MTDIEEFGEDCFPKGGKIYWLDLNQEPIILDGVTVKTPARMCNLCFVIVPDGPLFALPYAPWRNGVPPSVNGRSSSLSGHILYHRLVVEGLNL